MKTKRKPYIWIVITSLLKGKPGHMFVFIHNLMGRFSFRRLHKRMSADAMGQMILQKRPVITPATVDLSVLKKLPQNTFGYLFYDHLVTHGFDKDYYLPPDSFWDNDKVAYVRRRWRDTHDFRHALAGLSSTPADETVLSAFQYANFPNTFSLCIMVLGPLFSWKSISPIKQWRRLVEAYKAGKQVQCMGCFDYEAELSTPIDELRKKWNIKDLSHLSILRK